ncbi:hypothetical protein EXIGLDRAFT_731609, partial [Exidia glandulosa HHB12029]
IPQLSAIPANAAHLAHDTERDVLIAYDLAGHILGELPASAGGPALDKRDPGTCANISGDDVQRLPGWNMLSDYAKDNWGDNWDTVDANPSDYPDRGAQLCVSGDIAQVTFDGEPTCNTQSQTSGGSIVGADGTVALSATQGTTTTTTVTVTKASSIAVGVSVAATVSFPEIVDVTSTVTSTVTFTNELSTANTFTTSDTQTQTLTVQSDAGKTCSLTFDVQTCNANGHGSQRMVANGWAWIYYGKKKQGHYKWAINMDVVIPDEEQRATYIDFTTSSSSNTQAQYSAVCQ